MTTTQFSGTLNRDNTPEQNRTYVKNQLALFKKSLAWLAVQLGIANASKLEIYSSEKKLKEIEDILTLLAESYTAAIELVIEDSHITTVNELADSPVEVTPVLTLLPQMVSGFGQFHTNEADPAKPDKRLTPYLSIGWSDIQKLVDNPPAVPKAQAQWLIPSILPSRTFKEQEAEGQFPVLWADMDKNPPPLDELAIIVNGILEGADFELYNTRSATEANQKARLLIPLETPLSGKDFMLAQEILNDKLEALGIVPDRANQRAAQLCYLPNKGEFYGRRSKRGGLYV